MTFTETTLTAMSVTVTCIAPNFVSFLAGLAKINYSWPFPLAPSVSSGFGEIKNLDPTIVSFFKQGGRLDFLVRYEKVSNVVYKLQQPDLKNDADNDAKKDAGEGPERTMVKAREQVIGIDGQKDRSIRRNGFRYGGFTFLQLPEALIY
ncbi:hypothetical protein LOZ61_001439 [Ophidiomyces ophidiicola]|nr:hypothetical protein LOZ61_001439 [Ophidiomyces ophidiicola]KAI1930380.1 hypothetical protein LOZ60_000939 [Ophidiomyces ophidiicola]KAI1967241.1 hypothetical protein LOZ59_000901 [Ophidiomyces ophidiicola]KAI1975082.1 hypothetical protein LOZ56_000873 [Ophidiomyces ophidiicola]KAI2037028.1 hypothetical protein LOZ48_000686 [Ophidiomyces ophidiicola]